MKPSEVIMPTLFLCAPTVFASQIEFDVSEMYECYNEAELVFFHDGRVSYDGDDFSMARPTHWLVQETETKPYQSLGIEFTRVSIGQGNTSITTFDSNESLERFNELNLPEVGDTILLSTHQGPVAFAIDFEHYSADLDVTFEIFDPNNPESRAPFTFGLACGR